MFGSAGVRRVVAALSLVLLAAAVTAPPAVASSPAATVQVDASAADASIRGQGIWACLACAVGAGVVIAGGIGGIAAFLATPGSEALIAVCAVACYEAVQ